MDRQSHFRPVVQTSHSVPIHPSRRGLYAIIILLALISLAPAGFASTPVTAGFRDFNYGTGPLPFPSGQKTESKLWWNDGSWWGALWSPTANAWHIYQFDPSIQDWNDTGTPIDTRRSLADCLWDGTNQKLYVVTHVFTETGSSSTSSGVWGRLYRFTYGSGTKTYTLDTGFPVTVTRGEEATLTIAKDSFGILWVAYVENSQVLVNHSTSNDATWGTPFLLPGDSTAVNTNNIDISGVISFGGNRIGVMWSNELVGKFFFAAHNDGDADSVWQPVETAMPAPGSPCTGNCSHRHLNLKADSAGNIYGAGLSGLSGTSNIPNSIFLMRRDTSGTWANYQVSAPSDSWVRPVVELDEQNGTLYAFADSPGSGGVIYYKTSPLGSISFPTGIGTQFIQSSTDTTIANPSGTKQPVDGTSGLLILASDQNTLNYLHNFLSLPGGTAPVINSFSPTSGAVGASVTLTGSNFTGATSVAFNGTNATSFTVNSDTQITTAVPSGSTTGPIAVTSPGGTGTSTTSFTVQGPPTITNFTPTSGAPGAGVTIFGSGFTGTTQVAFNGTAATFTVSSDTQIATTVPAGSTTGAISVTTPLGTATSSTNFTVLTQGPVITSFVPTSGPVGTSVTMSGSGFSGATSVTFNGTPATQFSISNDAQMNAIVPSGATTGPIAVTNAVGTGASTTNFTVTGPSIVSFSPTSGGVGTPVVISGAGFTGASSVKFNGTAAVFTVNSDAQITTAVPVGATTGPISVTTAAGTSASATSFTVIGLPVIGSFSPTSGIVGTAVVINGSNFTGATGVQFNGVAATFTVASAKKINAVVPAGATTGLITVTTPAGTGISKSNFTVIQPPAISSFSPDSGPAKTVVTIAGSGFTGTKSVAFNGVNGPFKVVSDTQITATVPGAATTGPITVTDPAGTATSATSFVVTGKPVVSSFSPASGPVGTPVTLTGSGFTGTTKVTFGGVSATFTVDSDTQISTTVPTGAKTGKIAVTNPAGTGSSATNFTVL